MSFVHAVLRMAIEISEALIDRPPLSTIRQDLVGDEVRLWRQRLYQNVSMMIAHVSTSITGILQLSNGNTRIAAKWLLYTVLYWTAFPEPVRTPPVFKFFMPNLCHEALPSYLWVDYTRDCQSRWFWFPPPDGVPKRLQRELLERSRLRLNLMQEGELNESMHGRERIVVTYLMCIFL